MFLSANLIMRAFKSLSDLQIKYLGLEYLHIIFEKNEVSYPVYDFVNLVKSIFCYAFLCFSDNVMAFRFPSAYFV